MVIWRGTILLIIIISLTIFIKTYLVSLHTNKFELMTILGIIILALCLTISLYLITIKLANIDWEALIPITGIIYEGLYFTTGPNTAGWDVTARAPNNANESGSAEGNAEGNAPTEVVNTQGLNVDNTPGTLVRSNGTTVEFDFTITETPSEDIVEVSYWLRGAPDDTLVAWRNTNIASNETTIVFQSGNS